jgi:chromosome partitioning protein
MDTKIIAICNHKGGVAKTTTVASLGASLASLGHSVLLVDLDAQSNLTSSLLGYEPERSTYEAIRDREGLPIEKVGNTGLSLAGASLDLAGIELEISTAMERERILQDVLSEVADKYEYILLDCPPSLGLLTLNALTASTDVIIPLTAEALPSKGLQKITDIIQMTQKRLNKGLRLSGILITRYERNNLSLTVEEAIRERYGELVYDTKIRKNVSLAEAPLAVQTILEYAPTSNGAKDYLALAKEIETKLK